MTKRNFLYGLTIDQIPILVVDWQNTNIWLGGRGAGGYWTWHGLTSSNFSEFASIWVDGHPTASGSGRCTVYNSQYSGIYSNYCSRYYYSLCESN